MAPTRLPCPYTSCTFSTVESELAEGLEMLKMHERAVHALPTLSPAPIAQQVKPEKVLRPQLQVKDGYVTEETFEYFVHSWNEYKEMANVGNASKQHLAKCLGDEVSALLYGKYGSEGYGALDEKTLLEAAKMMVVKSRNKLVMQLQLQRMMQGAEQPIQTYVASLKATARTCGYKMKCSDSQCNKVVDYTGAMVLQQMIRGLADEDIQRKLLAKSEMTLEEAEKFVMAEESGKWSTLESGPEPQMAAGLSNYSKQQWQPLQKDKNCFKCGKP